MPVTPTAPRRNEAQLSEPGVAPEFAAPLPSLLWAYRTGLSVHDYLVSLRKELFDAPAATKLSGWLEGRRWQYWYVQELLRSSLNEETLRTLGDQLGRVFEGAPPPESTPNGVDESRTRLDTPVADRLAVLAALPDDWDGYGASALTPWAIAVAQGSLKHMANAFPGMVAAVFIAPSTDGGVRLEWVLPGGRELTVIIPAERTGGVEFYRSDERQGFEEDVSEEDLSRLPEVLSWLATG